MKRLLTLALMIAAIQTSFAQFGSSILNIKASDNRPLTVILDGRNMGTAENFINLRGIAPGQHSLLITRSHRLVPNGIMLYDGAINITANTEAFYTVLVNMNKIAQDRIVALNVAHVSPWQQQPGKPIIAPVYPGNCEPAVPVGPVAMSNYEFDQLRATLHNASFESTRMMILKQALPYNYFTTAQVRSLMNEFWFESSKLEVAKAAYVKTLDQYNYYLVNNEFAYGSSVRELGEYLAMN